ncbi:VCBS repeat-containing protein [bacterium]|nr:VCBS repeat-containing protein [bacterium]
MRISNALLAIFLLLCTISVQAERVNMDDAQRVGENFLNQRLSLEGGWNGRSAASAGELQVLTRDGRLLCYWMSVHPIGHIILSPLRELPAVKAFSDTDNFDPDAEGYATLIQDVFELTLDFLETNYGDLETLPSNVAPARNRESWDRLLAGAPASRDRITVGPLLSSDWHQGGPFNNDCPEGDGGLCVVGCVATAAAQILKYWEYPEFGLGSYGYTWDGDESCGGNVGGGFLEVQFWDSYNWDSILDSYGGGYDAEQAAAAAELNYEMGVAFDMDYGACASGAYLQRGLEVYPNYYDYSDDLQYVRRNLYTATEWWDIIKTELSAIPPRPISYGIHSHAIVCDGYMEDGGQFYHMNYGWGGSANAWYALDDVYCPWDGCDFLVENMTIGIEPKGHFGVNQPDDGVVWIHGEAMSLVAWSDSEGSTVSADLYYGLTRLTRLFENSPNDNSEIPEGLVPLEWGTGADFRIKVIDENDKFGWSDYFSIYGPAEWSDAGLPPVDNSGNGQSAAWGDYDGDGMVDIYLANKYEDNCLFQNLGGGSFEDMAADPLNAVGDCQASAWADMDNDGDLDIFLTRTSGETNLLFRNDGGGFTDLSTALLGGSSYSSGMAWGDYDNDGLVDLYVANVYAADRLFHNEGDGIFSEATAAPMGDAGYGRSANWTDYDEDGDLDLYLVRYSSNRLYRNNGDGSFTRMTSSILADAGDGYGAAWGDYDNDGHLDCYLVNGGDNKLFRNEGGGVYSEVISTLLADSGAGRGAAWADTDNDGNLDLFLSCDGANRLYNNNGDGSFSETTDALLGDGSDTRGAAWGDFDLDGRLDLYMVNYGSPNRLIRNENNSGNNWLHVDLVGTISNRSGLGSKVHLTSGGQRQIREVGSDTAYMSQGSLRVEFGLAGSNLVDSLEVIWPSGAVSLLRNLSGDQIIEVTEPNDPTGVEETTIPNFTLLGVHPNPFNPATQIIFELAVGGNVRAEIFDVQGRSIHVLADGYWAPGQHRVTWDGRNGQGEEMGSGLYLLQITGEKYRAERKLILLK